MGPNSSIISFTYQNKDYALTSMRSPTNICASQIKKAKEWYKSLDMFPYIKSKIDKFEVKVRIPIE